MRVFLVVLLAVVAIGAAGVWALAQFGDVLTVSHTTARAPLVREPELIAAADTTTVAPPAANPAPSLRSATTAEVQTQSAPADAAPAPSAKESATKPSAPLASSLDAAKPAEPAAIPPPAPPPAPAEPVVTPQSVPAVTPAPSPAAAATTAATSIADQYKSRRLTYNQPPSKLALNKPIDISLIIDSTGQNQAAEALKNLPGTVVERDVNLSDFVSAELKGADFDIQLQTTAPRQKLSPKIANEWRWRVTPTAVGTRTLTLTVYGYATGSLDAEPLDSYHDEIVVEVQQLDELITWAKGVQPLFALLAALAGATSALFAVLRFREERRKNKTA